MSVNVTVVEKKSHATTHANASDVKLVAPSVVKLSLQVAQVASITRDGDALAVGTIDGQAVIVHGFFDDEQPLRSDLVLTDGDKVWLAYTDGIGAANAQDLFSPIDSIDPLLVHDTSGFSSLPWILGGLAVAGGVAGVAVAVGSRHSDSENAVAAPALPNADVTTAPQAPAVSATQNASQFDGVDNTLVAGGDAVEVNTTTTGTNGVLWGSIADNATGVALEQGGYVVVWVNSTSASTANIYAQQYDAAGNQVGDSILVSTVDPTHLNFPPTVDALDDGGFAISWTNSQATVSTIGTSGDNPPGDIDVQVYNADGTVRPADDTTVHPGGASYLVASANDITLMAPDAAVHTLSDAQSGGVAYTGVNFVGNGGDDTFVIRSLDFTAIDGEGGFNTITFGTPLQGQNVSLVGLANIYNISDINMGDVAGTTLTLTLADVLKFTPTDNHSLMIDSGATNATLDIDESNWVNTGTENYRNASYDVYTSVDHTAELLVKASISVV